MLNRSKDPFVFKSQHALVEILAGAEASDIVELLQHLRTVPESSIYYHTHHYLQQHQHLTPEPPNDLAYWVTEVLQEEELGERLAAIDTIRFGTLEALRAELVRCIETYAQADRPLRKSPPGEKFYYMKCVLFNMPTNHRVHDLREFLEALRNVTIRSLYNHIFEARLRPPLGLNDFSHWLDSALGEKDLAAAIQQMDPYTQTLEGLRGRIVRAVERRLAQEGTAS